MSGPDGEVSGSGVKACASGWRAVAGIVLGVGLPVAVVQARTPCHLRSLVRNSPAVIEARSEGSTAWFMGGSTSSSLVVMGSPK